MSGQFSHFISHENTRKPLVFLVFSGGIKWEHWLEMGSHVADLLLSKKHLTEGFYLSRIHVFFIRKVFIRK